LTGPTGHLGSVLLPLLLEDPAVERVSSVARRPLPAHPKLSHTQADLRDAAAHHALEGVDVLFHLGFQLWRSPDAEDANLGGTRNVVAADPGRIVFASSAAVYGGWPDNPVPIGEEHEPRPNAECAYAAHKLEAERICAAGAPTVVLRICAVLGPHADPLVRKASRALRRVVPAARGRRQAVQFAHEDDVVAALHRAATSGVEGTYNVATADWLSEDEVAAVSGGRVVRLPFPLLVRGSEVAARLRLLDFGADRAVFLNGPMALSPERAGRDWGWEPARSSAEVLRKFLSARRGA